MDKKQHEDTMAAIEKFREDAKSWTKEQALDWLVKLGTHNPDGTLHENYGGEKKKGM